MCAASVSAGRGRMTGVDRPGQPAPSDVAADDRPVAVALRALGLGDLLTVVPALKAMQSALPQHRLLLATAAWLAPVVALLPGHVRLVPAGGLAAPLPLERGSVDVVANLHGNGRESRAIVDALGARRTLTHALGDEPGTRWLPQLPERVRWLRLLTEAGMSGDPDDVAIAVPVESPAVSGAAVVHVGAAFGSRRWPVGRFAAVAEMLEHGGVPVVFSGGTEDRVRAQRAAALAGLPERRVLAGRQPLGAFAALVAAARVVVSADTGAAHLASAYGVPSVVLFGPASPEQWGPPPGPHIALTVARLRVGDLFGDQPDPALLAVTVADVVAALRDLGVLPGAST